MKKLFVGSLAWATNDDSLKEFFSQFGEVSSASVVTDRESHRSRGFGFVEFADDAAGDKAIAEANGKELDGREINVSEAQSTGPKEGGFRPRNNGSREGGFRGGDRRNSRDNNRGGFGGGRRSFGSNENRGNAFRTRGDR